ncbi:MAG TPA: isochorismatase family cysteine hydrolase, partial [Terriglobia bacterium]|nr:isochorismatase family cysteine hydrolase [Terriglobia bacterium]
MAAPLAFFDVDTQIDFMEPHGRLYVRGAEEIRPRLKRLMEDARTRCIPILSSADAHPPNDPSFARWPPHCVVGTAGQQRIPETLLPGAYVVPNRPGVFEPPREWPSQVIMEKQEYDASTNANFDAILKAMGQHRFAVFGVATDYCVRWTTLSLLKKGLSVQLVTDAIKAIDEQEGRRAIDE